MSQKVAVVTGANRGIGFGVAKAFAEKGYLVVMVGRNSAKLEQAANNLKVEGFTILALAADVANTQQVEAMAGALTNQVDQVDVLINAAGVIGESDTEQSNNIAHADPEVMLDTLNINSVGAFRMIQALLPMLEAAPAARVVNISSGMGGIQEMEGGWPAYRMSKAAMNALTKVCATDLANTSIKVNSICPGWVRTDMGGANADRSVDEALGGILWAAELPADGPSGGFFRDGRPINF
jgi:NAD(P)-dependent dehydrogenase (short-subunit alcohol dehydrogenase family)